MIKQQPNGLKTLIKSRIEAEISSRIVDADYGATAFDDYCLECLRNGLRQEYRNLLFRQRVTNFQDAVDYILHVADDVKLKPDTNRSQAGLNAVQHTPNQQRPRSDMKCLHCGKTGHRFRNCRTASETK